MTASTEKLAAAALEAPALPRPVQEVAVTLLFGPLADRLVRVLLPVRVPPPAVVVAHAALGLLAAYLVVEGSLVAAALLLQAKSLLDNVDGRLARASGRADLLGRYLDTEADFVVNAALLAALAAATGEPLLSLAAFLALTLVLSVDFNVSGMYAETRGTAAEPVPPSEGRLERLLARVYSAVFAPQDRLVRSFSERRLERVLAGAPGHARREEAVRAYHDRTTVAVLANLGLSTQLLALGALLAVGAPTIYPWLVVAALGLLPLLQLRRERLARRALAR